MSKWTGSLWFWTLLHIFWLVKVSQEVLHCWVQVVVTSFQEGWFCQPWRRWWFTPFLRKHPWTWTLLDNLARVGSWDGSKHSAAPEGPGWNMDPFQMEVRSGYSTEMILIVLADNLWKAQDGAGVSKLAFPDHFSFGVLQHALYEAAFEDHSETSAIPESSSMWSSGCPTVCPCRTVCCRSWIAPSFFLGAVTAGCYL